MSTGWQIAISAGSSTVLVALINGIFTLINNRNKIKHGEGAGVRTLLYDRIKHLCIKYIEAGGVTVADLEDLTNMHKVYHDELKGNGFLDGLMNQVKQLPIIPSVHFYNHSNGDGNN